MTAEQYQILEMTNTNVNLRFCGLDIKTRHRTLMRLSIEAAERAVEENRWNTSMYVPEDQIGVGRLWKVVGTEAPEPDAELPLPEALTIVPDYDSSLAFQGVYEHNNKRVRFLTQDDTDIAITRLNMDEVEQLATFLNYVLLLNR